MVWTGNRLVGVTGLDDDELERVRLLFEARYQQRKKHGQQSRPLRG
jgi:hypothetical protein